MTTLMIPTRRAAAPALLPMRTLILTLILSCAVAAGRVGAEPQRFDSGPAQTALLELYTSEGCSSCPPADRWLSGLLDDERLWRELVPVAFHVDYWDYIGWPDRFASPRYGERQRDHARYGALRSVYTPGLVLNGDEWRGWFIDRTLPAAVFVRPAEVGRLSVVIGDDGGAPLAARFTPVDDGRVKRPLTLHLTLLGFGLGSDVDAGENRGRRLEHDFVVLGYRRQRLQAGVDDAGRVVYDAAAAALPNAAAGGQRRALAAWISSGIDPRPLQALGGWLR